MNEVWLDIWGTFLHFLLSLIEFILPSKTSFNFHFFLQLVRSETTNSSHVTVIFQLHLINDHLVVIYQVLFKWWSLTCHLADCVHCWYIIVSMAILQLYHFFFVTTLLPLQSWLVDIWRFRSNFIFRYNWFQDSTGEVFLPCQHNSGIWLVEI